MSSSYDNPPQAPPSHAGEAIGHDTATPPQPATPRSVINAVRLMIVGAALNIVSAVIVLATLSELRERLTRAYPSYSGHRVAMLTDTEAGSGIAISLVFTVLSVVLAKKVRDGWNWARIVTWIVAGISLIDALRTLASTDTPFTRVASLVVGLLDIGIVVLLLLDPSSRYFKPRPY